MVRRRDDLLIGPYEKTKEAIEKGNSEEALKHLEETRLLYRGIHDRYGDWINILFTFISKKLGEDMVKDANEAIMDEIYDAVWAKLSKASYEDILNLALTIHRSHFSDYHVEEDDEKAAVVITGCGCGGRMMKEGKYDNTNRHSMMGGTTKRQYEWSFGRAQYPYYCTHVYFLNKLSEKYAVPLRIEYGRQYDDDGNPIEEYCKYIVYKVPGYHTE